MKLRNLLSSKIIENEKKKKFNVPKFYFYLKIKIKIQIANQIFK